MGFRKLERTKGRVLRLLFVALACKFIVPVNYMPAPPGEGGPFRMCGMTFTAHAKGHDSHEQHGHDSGSQHDSAWEHCSFGILLSEVGIHSDFEFHVPFSAPDAVFTAGERLSAGRFLVGYRSRAPPSHSLI